VKFLNVGSSGAPFTIHDIYYFVSRQLNICVFPTHHFISEMASIRKPLEISEKDCSGQRQKTASSRMIQLYGGRQNHP